MADYISWVPTIGGRLSFSIAGQSSSPDRAIYSNVACNNWRYLVCYQRRCLLDVSFPFFDRLLAKYVFNRVGDFWFLVICKAENSPGEPESKFEGKVLVFSNYEEEWRSIENLVKTAQQQFREADELDASRLADIYSDLSSESGIFNEIANKALYFCDFELKRNGLIEITKSTPQQRQLTPLGSDKELDDDIVCRQVFYFLKDITHIHQHHHPKSDTIVDLHAIDDEFRWREAITRSLYRKVLSFKRTKSIDTYASALGVLSYLETFINVTKSEVPQTKQNIVLDNDNIRKSINTNIEKLKYKESESQRFQDVMRNTILALIGIAFSCIGLARFMEPKPTLDPDSHLAKLLKWCIGSPEIAFITLIPIVFLVSIAAGGINPFKWRATKQIVRLLLAYNKFLVSMLLYIGCFLSLSGAIYFWLEYVSN